MYLHDQPRNSSHVNDPRLTGMLKEQMRIKELEARRKLLFAMQPYAAAHHDYVDLYSVGITGSWQPYVKNYAPNPTFDYGGRAAALWLDKGEEPPPRGQTQSAPLPGDSGSHTQTP